MKRFVVVLTVVLALAVLVAQPVFALQADGGGTMTDPVQLFLIGVIASAVVYGIKLVAAKMPDVEIRRDWLTIFLYVVSLALAAMWGGVVLPEFGGYADPVTFVAAALRWAGEVLVALGPSVGFATLIYNVLLQKVFDGLAKKAGLK